MRLLFTFFLFVCFLNGLAQNDYVVTVRADTIYGEVTLLLPESLDEPVKLEADDGTRQFHSHELRRAYVEGEPYKTIKHGDRYRIMKEIVPGYLGLYTFRPEQNYEFGSQYLYKATNEGIEVSAIFFRNSVSKFLSECEKIVNAIDNKKYGYNDVKDLVRDYNRMCVNNDESSGLVPETKKTTPKSAKNDLAQLKEVNTLIADILKKMDNGESVPGYMKDALKDYAEKDLNEMVSELLKRLDED